MKTLLITLLLIFGMKIYGQQIKFANHPMDSIGRVWTRGDNYDTIFIEPGKYLKFIKIGERVYKIESPTLTEVKKEDDRLQLIMHDWKGSPILRTTDSMMFKGNFYNNGGYLDTSNIIHYFTDSELKGVSIKKKQP